MNCNERRDLLLEYAAGAMDAPEAAEMRAHLASGCPQCAGALAEAEATIALVAGGLNPIAPPAKARDRLMGKILSERPRSSAGRLILTGAIAACIGAMISAAILWGPTREKMRLVDNPNVRFVSLGGGEPQPKASGRIFWDQQKNNWHVYVFDLHPPAAGKEYELWFINTDQKKIPAGTFRVDDSGRGSLVVSVPKDVGTIAAAAVTDEPIGGAPQPTGSIQLVGNIK